MKPNKRILFLTRTKTPPDHRGCFGLALYQLGNWMAGKTYACFSPFCSRLYQLGNWMAGKTKYAVYKNQNKLYQLGNWMAGKTNSYIASATC